MKEMLIACELYIDAAVCTVSWLDEVVMNTVDTN